MSDNKITRKSFLRNVSVLGATAFGASSILAACGREETGTETQPQSQPQPQTTTVDEDPCGDLSNLSEADLNMRRNLQYVHQTPNPDQRCDNCQLWIEPENGTCGGCTLFRGPVNPEGWCISWVAEQA